MAEPAGINIKDMMGIAKRRAWIVALCFALITPLATMIAYVLPPVYRAEAKILVEGQQIPGDLAQSIVTSSAAEQIEILRQRLLTRRTLISIIEKFNLYGQSYTLGEKIEKLREAIEFESINLELNRRDSTVSAVAISTSASSATVSASVANELVTLAVDLSQRQRTEQAVETVSFFRGEAARLSDALEDQQRRLLQFKRDNFESLPDGALARSRELAALQDRRSESQLRRIALEGRRQELELILTAGVQFETRVSETPEEEQLRALKSTLAQQLGVLSGNHPTIRALKARIAALEAQESTTPGEADSESEQISRTQFQRERLNQQLKLNDDELQRLNEQEKQDLERMAFLQDALSKAPETEQALRDLEGQGEQLRDQLEAVQAKLAVAQTGEKLEVNRQAERLVVIEQAQAPEYPESPNRILIAGAGSVASIFIGAGIAVLLELLNSAIRTSGELERKVGLRPIVVIPYIRTRREVLRRRIIILSVLGAVLIGVPGALFLIDQYYLPLTVLAERISDKLGLKEVVAMIEARF